MAYCLCSPQFHVGSLYLDNTRLKGELLPIAQAALDNIKGTLKDVAREKCKEVHALLATRTKALGESCSLPVEYAPGTKFLFRLWRLQRRGKYR